MALPGSPLSKPALLLRLPLQLLQLGFPLRELLLQSIVVLLQVVQESAAKLRILERLE